MFAMIDRYYSLLGHHYSKPTMTVDPNEPYWLTSDTPQGDARQGTVDDGYITARDTIEKKHTVSYACPRCKGLHTVRTSTVAGSVWHCNNCGLLFEVYGGL